MTGSEFEPLFIFILIGISVGIGMFSVSYFLGPKRTTEVKQMPYESGVNPIGDARQRFDVRYYLVAIVFLLFDVELLYLYPWAVAQWNVGSNHVAAAPPNERTAITVGRRDSSASQVGIPRDLRPIVLVDILVFVGVLAAGYAYAWRKGVFEWR